MLRVVKISALVAMVGAVSLAGAVQAEASELNLTGSGSLCTYTSGGASCPTTSISGYPGVYSFAGALWSTTQIQPTGSGYIDSFVRIQDATLATKDVVDGMNTSGTLVNDEKPGPTFTHDVLTNDVQTTTINGKVYYQFLLDINQTGSDPLLSLSGLQLCQSNQDSLSFVDTCAGQDNTTPDTGDSSYRYDLDGSFTGTGYTQDLTQSPNSVKLNYALGSGSGSGDLFVYIPQDDPTTTGVVEGIMPTGPGSANKYLYLWSQFGLPENNNDGYEEWAFIHKGTGTNEPFDPIVPEPGTLVLFGSGLLVAAHSLRRRARRAKEAAQA